MRVENKFYSEASTLWQKAGNTADEALEEFIADRGKESVQAALPDAQETLDRIRKDRRSRFQVMRGEKVDQFEKLSHRAVELAEETLLDIAVETEQTFGRITFRADCLMLLPSSSESAKELLASMIREAESTEMTVDEDGLLNISFVFPFTSGVSRSGRD